MIWVTRHIQYLHRICIQIYPPDGYLLITIVGAIRSDVQPDAVYSIRFILDLSLDAALIHCNILK
ncbi:hypothetical protein WL15_20765 [Burkholderia multivorans]|nr:hypothetical protein WL15_20765 [Burkholderia multivorans]